jgi:hypothetical protein
MAEKPTCEELMLKVRELERKRYSAQAPGKRVSLCS